MGSPVSSRRLFTIAAVISAIEFTPRLAGSDQHSAISRQPEKNKTQIKDGQLSPLMLSAVR
jgi:hypothetical protein